MAANSTKSFLADAGYGEQELDANSALMELDKGIQKSGLSGRIACWKWRHQVVVASREARKAHARSFGGRGIRVHLLGLGLWPQREIAKIIAGKFRIAGLAMHQLNKWARFDHLRAQSAFPSSESGWQISKNAALKLMLGSLASIIPERKNAHHSIRQSLDSHDNVEVEAAVFAAANFSAQSKDFAIGICNKISEMIQASQKALSAEVKAVIKQQLESVSNGWTVYRIARQASRMGNHDMARELYQSLLTQVASEHFYFWLNNLLALEQDAVFGLESLLVLCSQDDSPGAQATLKIALNCMVKLAKGRPHLSQSVVETLLTQMHGAQDAARILMCHCLAAIAMQLPVLGDGMLGDLVELYKVIGRSATDKQQELLAASTPLNPLSFQCEFVKLRIDLLQAFSQLICTCNSLKTSPPPAIATTIAMTLGNDLQRCGRISNQMKQSTEEFRSLASRYGDLYQASFDADSATLRNVELQQQSCLLISHAIEALILDPESASFQEYGSTAAAHADSEYERRMMSVYNHVLEEVESLNRKYTPVSYMLALSPSPRNPAEPIAVQNNQQLALKVEGVVQHGSKPGLFRKIQSVCLNVSSTLQSKSGQDYKIPIDNMTNEMEQRVEPHNDYFSTQFLLNFAILGTHNITVESSVKDANGIVWKTGPRTTIFVKSLEDPYSQQIRLQQQQAQQPLQQQQQRNAYTRF
ncbi:PREDICTED: integrator complex subunit 7 [Propithecus coquereli]|uniref:integrator complex subunit 7 n=1 Tax=Propithecus coquereli TaxID=379532 RepID=UPI00063F72AC|nr:PREDICTED: integrator complex subunit 7 [Propithecus coquereli]